MFNLTAISGVILFRLSNCSGVNVFILYAILPDTTSAVPDKFKVGIKND